MDIVLERLRGRFLLTRMSIFGDCSGNFLPDNADLSSERLSARLDSLGKQDPTKKHAAIKLLLEEDSSLCLEYTTTRALLLKTLSSSPVDEDKAIDLIKRAILLADILCINNIGRINKTLLEEHLALYEAWLKPSAVKESQPANNDDLWQTWFCEQIQWLNAQLTTENLIFPRLFFLRNRRLAVLLAPVISEFLNYSSWVLWADAFVAPVLAHLGYLFFLPRLYSNLITLQNQITFQDNELDLTHLNAQWNRLWPNVTNDFAWAISGAFMCFILIGSLQPWGIYLSVGMQFYDVLMASIRAHYELSRLEALAELSKQQQPDAYVEQFEKVMQCEKNGLYLSFNNATALLLAISLALPTAAAIHPMLLIVGSVISVFTTLYNRTCRNGINEENAAFTAGLDDLLREGRSRAIPVIKKNENHTVGLEILPSPVVQSVSEEDLSPRREARTVAAELKLSRSSVGTLLSTQDFIVSPDSLRNITSCPDFNNFSFETIPASAFEPININVISKEEARISSSPTGVTASLSATFIRQNNSSSSLCIRPIVLRQDSGSGYGFYDCDSPTIESRIRASSMSSFPDHLFSHSRLYFSLHSQLRDESHGLCRRGMERR